MKCLIDGMKKRNKIWEKYSFLTREITELEKKGEIYMESERQKVFKEVTKTVKNNGYKLREEQLRLINWMYNFCIIEMKLQPEKFTIDDEIKLHDAVKRRFPEVAADIVKGFDI